MSNVVVVKDNPSPVGLSTVMGVPPMELMSYAIEVANTLSRVLRDRGMTRKFGAGEHVQAEGWQLAGSLMGFAADEGEVTELQDGSYIAEAYLKNIHTGARLIRASGRCGTDERNWKGKEAYARRSMAITRAISRAYAQNFRWLIKLAGFEGTPAEEMPPDVPYTETDEQKRIFAECAKDYGIKEKEVMAKLSASCRGIMMTQLKAAIAAFSENTIYGNNT